MSNQKEIVPVFRFMPTYINKDGMRQIFGAMQGRNTHATETEAQTYLDAVLVNNSEEQLSQIFGKQSIGTFRVSTIKCYPNHFDPMQMFVDDPNSPFEIKNKDLLASLRI